MSFSKRLKKLRKEKGLTLQELADKFHKTKATFSAYENGVRKPNIDLVADLADFFGVSIDYLMAKSDIRKDPNPKIKQALEDDPELLDFWEEISSRESMKAMFKQTRNLSDEAIKDVVRFMKRVEDEAEQRHN